MLYMTAARNKIWITILGYFFLILGIVGLFLPFLQGVLFILVGLALLSRTTPWAEQLFQRLCNRFPKLAKKSDEWMNRFKWKQD